MPLAYRWWFVNCSNLNLMSAYLWKPIIPPSLPCFLCSEPPNTILKRDTVPRPSNKHFDLCLAIISPCQSTFCSSLLVTFGHRLLQSGKLEFYFKSLQLSHPYFKLDTVSAKSPVEEFSFTKTQRSSLPWHMLPIWILAKFSDQIAEQGNKLTFDCQVAFI